MRRSLYLFFIYFSFVLPAFSQYVQVGGGSFLGMAGGPMHTSAALAKYASRFAYIFPSQVLGNMQHGDTLTSAEFMRQAGTGFNGSCNLKVYMKNTNLSDFGTGILRWSSEISGLTALYDQNPATDIGTTEGFHKIPFNNAFFVFDTTAGENLMVLIEYTQTAVQSNPVYWYFENSGTVSGYASNQTRYQNGVNLSDSLISSTDYHPTVIFNYPRFDHDIAVLKVYSLGKLPVPLGNPDSVKALVRNVGKKNQSTAGISTWIRGFNNGSDSTVFSIDAGANRFVNLPSLNPAVHGLDTVFAAIYGDQNPGNDTGFSYRLNNENVYSYRDVTQAPAPGGIGFNGQTGDFVARFFSNKSKAINQVAVQFFITGRPFKIGVWDNTGAGGKPGKLLYLSDSLNTVSGRYILDFKKPLSVNGTFFVGVRQLNTNNVAFGYQEENPVRPGTFFYASPYGDTNWIDFHPDAPFKFLIEPRLQGDTDLYAVSADYPRDSIDRHTTDTLAPRATIGNIGARSMTDSFDITCEIRFYGKLVYKKTLRDTMSPGVKRSYTFPKTFYPADFGEHELIVYTGHPGDLIRDNDTVRSRFYVGVKKDVMVATVFEPSDNIILEYLKDTLLPVANIQNPGYDNSAVFTARCRIFKGSTVVYNQVISLSLPRFNSKILIWPVYKCTDTGRLKVVFTTELAGDVYRANDTVIRYVTVFKSVDAGIDSVAIPDKNKYYTPKISFKPLLRIFNDGVLDAGPFKVICRITSPFAGVVYRDTATVTVEAKGKYLLQFARSFTPDRKGLYSVYFQTFANGDLVKFNDSLKQFFHVGFPYDYYTANILYPLATDTLGVGGGPYAGKIRMGNNGYVKNTDVVPVVFQVWRNGNRVYQDIKSLTLDTGASFSLEFSKNLNFVNAGSYEIIAYTNYVSDVNRKNDTIFGSFEVTVGKDAYVSAVMNPADSELFEARKDTLYPEMTIQNDGKFAMKNVRTYCEIYHGNDLLYFEKSDDSLQGGESRNLLFTKGFVPPLGGLYRMLAYTFSSEDQNISNDTFERFFNAEVSMDVQVADWLDPLPASVILHTSGARNPRIEITRTGEDTSGSLSGVVYFRLYNTAGNTEVFNDTVAFSGLNASGAVSVSAAKSWEFNVPGFYQALAFVENADLFPENDTLKTFFEVRLNGVKRLAEGRISVFPNPAGSRIQVISDIPVIHAEVFDMRGVRVNLIQESDYRYDISHLPAGLYEIRLRTADGIYSTTLVKQ